jgi:hypothetical protein
MLISNGSWYRFTLYDRFEVFTVVTMKNVVFWDVTPRDFRKNRCFGGTYRLHLQGDMIR